MLHINYRRTVAATPISRLTVAQHQEENDWIVSRTAAKIDALGQELSENDTERSRLWAALESIAGMGLNSTESEIENKISHLLVEAEELVKEMSALQFTWRQASDKNVREFGQLLKDGVRLFVNRHIGDFRSTILRKIVRG
jgi:hypothetical protein